MSDSDEVQILQNRVEKLESELQVSTDALHLARQQLQLQEKLIEDVDKLRKEVELANKRLEERDVQLQCLLRQLALTQTKYNELEEERNKKTNLNIPPKSKDVGEISLEACQEENEKLREVLREAQEKIWTSNLKQKNMRKEIDELTKDLYDYRNENKLGFYGCEKSTQTHELTDYLSGNKNLKNTDEKDGESKGSTECFPVWGIEEQSSLSIADSIKDVAEQIVQELNLTNENQVDEKNAEDQEGQNGSQAEINTSHEPGSSFVFDPASGMYYDSQSGYYYDSNSTLYYDPRTGTYFYYNHSTQEYEFHSKVDLPEQDGGSGVDDASSSSSTESDEESLAESSELEEGEIKEEIKTKIKSEKKKTKRKKKCQTIANGSIVSYLVPQEEDYSYNNSNSSSSTNNISSEPFLYQNDAVRTDVTDSDDYKACMDLYRQIQQQDTTNYSAPLHHQKQESSELWPPCIRLIVTESTCLDVGKLFIVTCTGASIGQRKKDLIQINDIGKAGLLAKISFDDKKQCYTVKGYCKHTAPCVNEKKVFQGHKPVTLSHEDWLTVGETKLSVHIHVGYDTCDDCEPGLVQAKYAAEKESKPSDCMSTSHEESKRLKHRKELMGIKKKYGLKDSAYVDNPDALKNPNYTDKALNRRKTVGSDNPYIKTTTEQTSVHQEISTENKGRKMLEKLGWSSGESLGKNSSGIVEPISAFVRMDPSAGLGSCGATTTPLSRKEKNWLNTKRRFNNIDRQKDEDISEVKPSKRHNLWVKGQTLNPS